MIWLILTGKQIVDKYSRDEMSVYAAQASFFIFLSAFPFLMLLLALIQIIPLVHETDLVQVIMNTFPDNLDDLVITIIANLYSDSSIALLSFSAVAALWSSSKGMLSIERGLNRAYGVTVRRGYLVRRLICTGYTILFTLMCVICLALLVFGSTLEKQLFLWIPQLSRFSFLFPPSRTLLSLGVLTIFFLAAYTVLPYKKQKIRLQLPGAAFSAIGWAAFSMAFSVYFEYFGTYTIAYGSLTAVILMMLWLYVCICILFLGAELNWRHGLYKEKAGEQLPGQHHSTADK